MQIQYDGNNLLNTLLFRYIIYVHGDFIIQHNHNINKYELYNTLQNRLKKIDSA
jgi:hypothetical protein